MGLEIVILSALCFLFPSRSLLASSKLWFPYFESKPGLGLESLAALVNETTFSPSLSAKGEDEEGIKGVCSETSM